MLAWRAGIWKEIDTLDAPSSPTGVAVWNPKSKRSLFFSEGQNGRLAVDEWDGKRWVHIESDEAPKWFSGFTAAWNPARETVQLFGGHVRAAELWRKEYGWSHGAVNELWEFDGENWRKLTLENAPPAAKAYVMAYDKRRGQMMMFERLDVNASVLNIEETPERVRTWVLGEESWEEMEPAWSPLSRHVHSAAWCEELGAVVAGSWVRPSQGWHRDVMPFFAWDGRSWHQLPIRDLSDDFGDPKPTPTDNTLGGADLIEWEGSVLLAGGTAVFNIGPDSVYRLVPAED
jgi:hypothetical protein